MKYTLRPYQQKAVEDGLNFFYSKSNKNMIEVLPTAAGKSIVIADIARQLDAPVLSLQPSKELLVQNYNKFISYGEKASIYSASLNQKEIGEVTFATIGSVYRKPELFDIFKYVIVDECHISSPSEGSMYQSFFENLNIKLLGFTATPFRLKSYSFPYQHSKLNMLHRIRPKIFQDIIHVTQIQEMIDGEFWSPIEYIVEEFDRSGLKSNSTGADYTEESISEALQSQNKIERTIYWYNELLKRGRKKILVFTPNIKTSELIAKKLGINSVSSNTEQNDRDRYIDRFRKEIDSGIVNVNVLSVGFDEQKIDAIIDLTPTLSLARYYQKLGRGVRIDLTDIKTKLDCIYVDLCGNVELFGKIEDIEFKRINNKWEATSNNKILTSEPLIKQEEKTPNKELENEEMNFGKFKGDKFKDIPKWYWKYVAEKINHTPLTAKAVEYARSII